MEIKGYGKHIISGIPKYIDKEEIKEPQDQECVFYYYTYRKTKTGLYKHFYRNKGTNQKAIVTLTSLLSKDMRNTKVAYNLCWEDEG